MTTIKVRTSVNEYTNTHHFATASIIDSIPAVGDSFEGGVVTEVYPALIDSENNDEVFSYNYYDVTVSVVEGHEDEPLTDTYLVAVKKGE